MVKTRRAVEPRLTPEAFVFRAIAALKTERFKGVHSVRSGFNQAFRDYFEGEVDPIETTNQMRKDGKIAVFLAKGGVRLYLRSDLTEKTLQRHDDDWRDRDQSGPQKKADKSSKAGGVLTKILKG